MELKQYMTFTLIMVLSCCCTCYLFLYTHLHWKNSSVQKGSFTYKKWHTSQLSQWKNRSQNGGIIPFYGRKNRDVENEQLQPRVKIPLYGKRDGGVEGEGIFKLPCMLQGYETENRNEHLIIYSKIPKCGGTTLRELFETSCLQGQKCYHLSHHNITLNLELKRVRKKYQVYINGLASHNSQPLPTIVSGHSQFLDFSESQLKQPLFIDILRDPIERWISLYYFVRSSKFQQKVHNVPQKDVDIELGDCIRSSMISVSCNLPTGCTNAQKQALHKAGGGSGSPTCNAVFKPKPFINWFSGRKRAFINKSKQNIEKYYSFLGILEHFEESLEALQKIFGVFGNDLVELNKRIPKMNIGKNKVRPSNETIDLMKMFLEDDYEIYYFALQRFYRQLKCLGINVEHKRVRQRRSY